MTSSHSAPVLILDDNHLTRSSLSNSLSRAGWEVCEAGNAKEGLELAKQGPQVIIVGLSLPEMSGAELCKLLKNEPTTRTIPVLHTPAQFLESDDPRDNPACEADAFLTDPVDPKELISAVRVLSRLRSAEAKAETHLAKLESVINTVSEGVITADRFGRFLSMNAAALRSFGFESVEAMPGTLDEQDRVIERSYPDGTPLPRDLWPILRAASGEIVSNFEMRMSRRDTGKTWIGSYNATLVTTAGLVIVTFFDLTERKETEKALIEAQSRLKSQAAEVEQKVEERTSALRQAISQMEEFSYTVSHDLRAPLRSIKGYAEILVEDQGPRMKGDGMKYLERIVENGERMERLVNDVLTISRISNTKVKLGCVALHSVLTSIVREYVNLQPLAARVAIDQLPPVLGHESLCIQIFSNLLNNAAKFVQPGVTPQIRVWATRTADLVRINVKDNGIGINQEYHQKVFGMFERLDADNRYGGTGIGLAIVRRAAEKMNGRVGVESDGQTGSCFWVELPAWTGEK